MNGNIRFITVEQDDGWTHSFNPAFIAVVESADDDVTVKTTDGSETTLVPREGREDAKQLHRSIIDQIHQASPSY